MHSGYGNNHGGSWKVGACNHDAIAHNGDWESNNTNVFEHLVTYDAAAKCSQWWLVQALMGSYVLI